MITNPYVGMRIYRHTIARHGTITMIDDQTEAVAVKFDYDDYELWYPFHALDPDLSTPEEEQKHLAQLKERQRQLEDQQRRKAHAEKYL